MKPAASSVGAVIFILGACAAVYAAPLVPNDPYYLSDEWYAPGLGLPTAWGYTTGSPAVTLAILDAGVMADTPDLAGRVLVPQAVSGMTVLDGTTFHHGTWAASVAAAGVNNGIGAAGVGDFSILPIIVADASGSASISSVAAGIRLAADAGARVINVSYAATFYGTLNLAAQYARSKGALVFMPIGNSDERISTTGFNSIVFVSGTGHQNERWDEGDGLTGSNWGPLVDLAAPAADILVANGTGGYLALDGTSFSSALAAGAAALVWSANPQLSPDQVLGILTSTATDLAAPGWDEVYGYGLINAGAAVAWAEAQAVPEPQTIGLMATGALVMLARRRRAGRFCLAVAVHARGYRLSPFASPFRRRLNYGAPVGVVLFSRRRHGDGRCAGDGRSRPYRPRLNNGAARSVLFSRRRHGDGRLRPYRPRLNYGAAGRRGLV